MADRRPIEQEAALARAGQIAEQLRDLQARIEQGVAPEVAVTLLEQATELAEEAARILEGVGGTRP